MPFVNKEHRLHPDVTIPGDRTYLHYKALMEQWRNMPRWTTVDAMLKDWMVDEDERAFFLAFLVFFAEHVMPYERYKMEENGDI